MAFSTFTILWDHCLCLEHFDQKNTQCPLAVTSPFFRLYKFCRALPPMYWGERGGPSHPGHLVPGVPRDPKGLPGLFQVQPHWQGPSLWSLYC